MRQTVIAFSWAIFLLSMCSESTTRAANTAKTLVNASLPAASSSDPSKDPLTPDPLKNSQPQLEESLRTIMGAKVFYKSPMVCKARQALLVDLLTNTVLYAKQATAPMPPSSMTKILTAHCIFQALKTGYLRLQDSIPISPNAGKKEGSRMFLEANKEVSLENLLKGIIVVSGNDACTAVAEYLAGDEAIFANTMNATAMALGATHSQFKNASGLPEDDHYSTCEDLGIIAKATIETFPEYYAYYKLPQFTFSGITQQNRNTLLRKQYADGMKTGKTDAGKFGMVASTLREGRRLLLVVNGIETESERAVEARRLLDWGRNTFIPLVFFEKGETVLYIPLWHGPKIKVVARDPIAMSLPKFLLEKIQISLKYRTPLVGPIQRGTPLGILSLALPGTPPFTFPLVAGETVPSPGWIYKLHRLFTRG